MAKRKIPPAQRRYNESHPTVSFRLTRELYDQLKRHLINRGGLSFADFVKESLGVQIQEKPAVKETRYTWYKHGFDDAVERYCITLRCPKCGEDVVVRPDSELHSRIKKAMRQYEWRHADCEPEPGKPSENRG